MVSLSLEEHSQHVITHLHVVNAREISQQSIHEAWFVHGQVCAGESLEQVSEVVAGVKRDPLDFIVQHQTRHDHQFSKVLNVNAELLKLLEVNARSLQQLYAILGEHVVAVRSMKHSNEFTSNTVLTIKKI